MVDTEGVDRLTAAVALCTATGAGGGVGTEGVVDSDFLISFPPFLPFGVAAISTS